MINYVYDFDSILYLEYLMLFYNRSSLSESNSIILPNYNNYNMIDSF